MLEADNVVGGISRTAERDGWRFDIGGHRFFTKVQPVEDLWHEILPDEDFLMRPRMSRIYYNGKYYDYPLKAMNALGNLGVIEAVLCVLSYVWARIRPPEGPEQLRGLGRRPASAGASTATSSRPTPRRCGACRPREMQADWAAQRIKNLSLSKAIVNALLPKRNQKEITSLIEEFQYPKYGPGMMWERCRDMVEAAGTKVLMETRSPGSATPAAGRWPSVGGESADGDRDRVRPCQRGDLVDADHGPAARPWTRPCRTEVLAAADDLHYRDFLTIALVVPEEAGFPDNWIYVHSPDVKLGPHPELRVLVAVPGQGGPDLPRARVLRVRGRRVLDDARRRPRRARQARARRPRPGRPGQVEAGYVVRMPKAYPYYDADYKANVEILRALARAATPPTCIRSAATACTSTTTRTTPCTPPC